MKKMLKKAMALVLAVMMIITGVPMTASAATYGNLYYEVYDGEARIADCKTHVTTVNIPAVINGYPVTNIGPFAFENCTALSSITIPDSVTDIYQCAFKNCTSLTSITIPDSVISISEGAFKNCTSLTSIEIPDSVTSIGSDAFYNTGYYNDESNWTDNLLYIYKHLINAKTDVTNVIIKEGTWYIDNNVFANCASLINIEIPDSVTNIGHYAFYNCTSLTSITIPDGVTSIGDCAFRGCTSLTSITIPASVKSFGWYVFEDCTSLTSVTIPDSVTSIGSYAFENCTSLTSITIPDGVTSISHMAFYNCSSLTSIEIPDSVTSIDSSAFDDCTSLRATFYKGTQEQWNNISIGSYNYSLTSNVYYNVDEDYLFEDSVLFNKNGTMLIKYGADDRYYVVPDGVKSIEQRAFYNADTLYSVILPEGLKNIGSYAFANSDNLTSVYIPASVTAIDTYAFNNTPLTDVYFGGTQEQWNDITIGANNSNLTSANIHYNSGLLVEDDIVYTSDKATLVCFDKNDNSFTVPSTVKTIGSRAFKDCKNLKEIILPDGLETINSYAFYGSSITEINIPDSVKKIGFDAFYECSSLTEATIGNGVTELGTYAFYNCSALTDVTIGNGVAEIGTYAFYNCSALTDVTIGNGVTDIGEYAFENCTALTDIEFSENLKTIGSYAFYGCTSLEALMLPDGLETINGSAFYDCTALAEIYFPDSLKAIGYEAFYGCSALTYVSLPDSVTSLGTYAFANCTNLEKICLPEGDISAIPANAFNGCAALEDIYIPANFTSIGDSAFYGCNLLTDIYYGGTEEQWNNISIPSSNSVIWAANIHFEHEHAFGEWIEIIPVENYKDGLEASKCSVCGYETRRVIPCDHVHDFEGVITTPATCCSTGVKTFTCTVCGDSYTESVAKDSANHSGGTEIRGEIKATSESDGYSGDTCCVGCDEILIAGFVIPALVHYVVIVPGTAATCTENGLSDGSYCAICGEVLKTQDVIPALGHDIVVDEAVEPTCTQTGLTEGYHCSRCFAMNNLQYIIPALGHDWEDFVCTRCGETDGEIVYDTSVSLGKVTGRPGETVTVYVSIDSETAVKSMSVFDIDYDSDKLTLIGGEWLDDSAIIADWNQNDKAAAIAFKDNTKLSGNIFALTFKIKENLEDSEVEVDCTVRIKALDENKVEQSLTVEVIPGKVAITNIIKGDVTGDDYVDSNDAIHLLYHTLIPERYDVNQNCDFDGDGDVDSNDAIYLLYHTLIPERYPLA